ncbi:MAG: hypothetical protein AAF577_04845 [Pseudomonadota bacterium]
MASFNAHPVLDIIRYPHFNYSDNLYPFQFKEYYHKMPVILHTGQKITVTVWRYMSGYTGDRNKLFWKFRWRAKKYYDARGRYLEYDWLTSNSKRVQLCFYGQGMPEEISMIARMAVECGHVKPHDLKDWVGKTFGMDCVGFANAYYCALGTFQDAQYYIPKYKQIGGVAMSSADIRYDNAVLWARPKAGSDKWEVRPNPGNKAHIGVIDCWAEYGRSFWMTHQGSSKDFITTEVFDILDYPKSNKENEVHWRIQRRTGGKRYDVIITRELQSWAQAA